LHKYLAVIPAREGSKRIPDKNLLSIGNRSLIQRAADSVRESEIYKNGEVRLVCCTNSARCRALAVSAEIELVEPPPWFGLGPRSLNETLDYIHGSAGEEIALLVLPTLPFRRGRIFDAVAGTLDRRPDVDVAMSMVETPVPIEWAFRQNGHGVYKQAEFPDGTPIETPDPTYYHDGQVYAIRTSALAQTKTVFGGGGVAGVPSRWPDNFDLDWPWQVEIAQIMAAGGNL